MILGIAHDFHPATTLRDRIPLWYGVGGVVSSFGVNVGANFADQGPHVALRENDDCVHVSQCRENFRAFLGEHERTALSFQCTHGFIGVDSDDQASAKLLGCMQVANVADVQHIENTVGQRDAIASAPPIRHTLVKFVARNDLLME